MDVVQLDKEEDSSKVIINNPWTVVDVYTKKDEMELANMNSAVCNIELMYIDNSI
jgi:hypothetical protein